MKHTRILTPLFCTFLASTLFALGCNNDTTRAGAPVGARSAAVQVTPTPQLAVSTGALAPVNVANHAEHPTSGATPEAAGTATTIGSAANNDALEAEAEFKSVPQMKLKGEAELDEVATGVRIVIEVDQAPAGVKGIHIHQTDDCSDIAKKSMGEHFAPTIHKHGLPDAPEHHLGDLGNITIDKDGNGKLDFTVVGANLKPNDPLSFIGKSIVIHESNDKGTGASGDAGKPIACAPIKAD